MLSVLTQEVAERLHVASAVREAVEKNTVKVDRAARADERRKTTLTVNLEVIKSLMKTMHWSPIEAMTAMEIPPDQQAIYIKKL